MTDKNIEQALPKLPETCRPGIILIAWLATNPRGTGLLACGMYSALQNIYAILNLPDPMSVIERRLVIPVNPPQTKVELKEQPTAGVSLDPWYTRLALLLLAVIVGMFVPLFHILVCSGQNITVVFSSSPNYFFSLCVFFAPIHLLIVYLSICYPRHLVFVGFALILALAISQSFFRALNKLDGFGLRFPSPFSVEILIATVDLLAHRVLISIFGSKLKTGQRDG